MIIIIYNFVICIQHSEIFQKLDLLADEALTQPLDIAENVEFDLSLLGDPHTSSLAEITADKAEIILSKKKKFSGKLSSWNKMNRVPNKDAAFVSILFMYSFITSYT